MDNTQRSEFEGQLGALFGAWGRTTWEATTEGYWKGLQHMSLADFTRCVDKAVKGLEDVPDAKLPNVGALWSIKRSLRASAPLWPQTVSDGWTGDKWDEAANRHLWNYLSRRVAIAKRYHPDSQMTRVEGGYQARAGVTGAHITWLLVAAKNRWADIMRAGQQPDGTVPKDEQREIWVAEMGAAEREIDALAKVAA